MALTRQFVSIVLECQPVLGGFQNGLKWHEVSDPRRSELTLSISHPRRSINDYKFAIAAHNENGSRGMGEWMTCLYDWKRSM